MGIAAGVDESGVEELSICPTLNHAHIHLFHFRVYHLFRCILCSSNDHIVWEGEMMDDCILTAIPQQLLNDGVIAQLRFFCVCVGRLLLLLPNVFVPNFIHHSSIRLPVHVMLR